MTALFCWSATAQNGVTVSNLNVAGGTVTFNVSWKSTDMPALWSDSVWVFVDYNKAGKMERLPISSATVSAGTVEIIPGNSKGVRLIGNARAEGSFSATMRLLTATDNLSGVCAYASNYPPVGEYIDATHISFTGTPMYKIILEETGGEGTLADYSDGLYTIRPGYTIQSFTDTTGAPGMMKCIVPDIPTGISTSRCGAGEVTISASSTSTGAVIDWYDVEIGGTPLLSGNDNYSTPSIDASTTYYAQARDTITHCVSASRTSVAATMNVIPTLILSSGSATASQTVDQNTPIADIIYTATSATIDLSSGNASLPAGVSGTITGTPTSGTTFTISGTPSATGTFNYSVTATHMDGGCTSTLSGSIYAQLHAMPSASTTTWKIGTLTWSDYLVVPTTVCTRVSTLPSNGTSPACVLISPVTYCNAYCIRDAPNLLCPNPWRLPTKADLEALKSSTTKDALQKHWPTTGWLGVGQSNPSWVDGISMWSSTISSNGNNYRFDAYWFDIADNFDYHGIPVYCVR
jgi:hypothetical protein